MADEREPRPLEPATRDMLRHTLATLAYRAAKAISGADPTFADFRPSPTSRTAGEVLAHMGDLIEWAAGLVGGEHRWEPVEPRSWAGESDRFFAALEVLDRELEGADRTGWSAERIFQGPVADALTHVGQLNLMRRMAGTPVRGENYAVATIVAGRVGKEQAEPKREFD